MNLIRKLADVISLTLLLGSPVYADVIVDTGQGGSSESVGLTFRHWLAAEFSLNQSHIITDVRGWIRSTGPGGQGLRAVIRLDNGNIPGSVLFSQSFFAGPIGGGPGWHGLGGLNWLLLPGEYWIAFEVDPSAPALFEGGMDWFGLPNPLSNHASGSLLGYNATDRFSIGVQIEGTLVASVPEPTTLALFGIGLAAIGLMRCRRKVVASDASSLSIQLEAECTDRSQHLPFRVTGHSYP